VPSSGISIEFSEFSFDAFMRQRKFLAVRKLNDFYTARWRWVLQSHKTHLSFPRCWQLSGCDPACFASLLYNEKCLDNISKEHKVLGFKKGGGLSNFVCDEGIILNVIG
jgi:hypothetical protein